MPTEINQTTVRYQIQWKQNEIKTLVEFYGEAAKKSRIEKLRKEIDLLKQELKKLEQEEFKETQSKIIYGRKDKVLKWDGQKLKELEE